MKIVIADIPDEGLQIDIEEKVDLEGISLISPVTAYLELNKTGKEIIVSGEVTTEVELQCSRCLKIFKRDLELPVEVVYHPLEEIGVERHELKDDELDMGFYKGEELDLKELLMEQLLLNIQMKPLCSEECEGLCPRCGTDLNMGKCGCEQKEVDPRLEVLRNFLKKRKE
jgi:uncharacterized protein